MAIGLGIVVVVVVERRVGKVRREKRMQKIDMPMAPGWGEGEERRQKLGKGGQWWVVEVVVVVVNM